jgi:hypothetical protein
MERNNRRKPSQQEHHHNDNNDATPNFSWLEWNAKDVDSGAATSSPSSGIGNTEKQQRSKSAPKLRRTQQLNQNVKTYGKLHSPTKKHQHGLTLHLLRPKSAGKQRLISANKRRNTTTTNNNDGIASAGHAYANATTGHATQQGGQGDSKHHSWASSLLLRKKLPKTQHGINTNNSHRVATHSSSCDNNGNKKQNNPRNTNVCDYCQRVLPGKTRSQLYQRAGYVYCSTTCTKFHHQALDAEANGRIGGSAGDVSMSRHVPSQSNTIGNTTKVLYTKSKSSKHLQILEPDHQQQQQHHLVNVSYEENTGNQFIPSMAKAATAASSTTSNSISQPKAQFPQNWFHQEHTSCDNGDIDIIGDKSTISFSNSWGAIAQPSLDGPSSTQSSDSSPEPSTNNGNTMNKYGRGITDEYQDYNDELSRQLRLAARQDELVMKERLLRRHQFINANHYQQQHQQQQQYYGQPSLGTFTSVSSNATSSEFSTRSGGGDDGFWSGDACDSSSPGRYNTILKNMGVHGLSSPTKSSNTSNKNSAKVARRTSRPKQSTLKQSENSTQSTESFSSSSQGGMNSRDVGSRNSGSGQSGIAYHEGGHLDDLAFEDLSQDFTNCDFNGMNKEDMKTPRKGNLSVMFAGVHNENTDDDHIVVREGQGRIDPTNGRDDDNLSSNNIRSQIHNNRILTKLSSPQSSSLYAISEEQSVSMDAPAINSNDGDLALFQLLAQKRGLRPITPQPTSSSSKRPKSMIQNSSSGNANAWADHAVEDVVSIVSHYDDPSVDMLSSLATNDTLTTTSQQRAGRKSPPFSRCSSDGTSRLVIPRTRTSQNEILKSQRQHTRSDPPGNSIDDILKEGVLLHQKGRYVHHNGRDASFQGVDPDDDNQVMNKQEHHNFKKTASDNNFVPRQQRQEGRSNAHHQPQYGRSPDIVAPPQLRSSQQDWKWSENGPTNNEHEHTQFGQDDTEFDVGGIEIPTHEMLHGDDTSIGMLTGEEDDEPPMSSRGDDDTAANTLDTVDLVAEVKRVWRHVQRYETKKHQKKDMKRQLRKNSRGINAANSGSIQKELDRDAMEKIRENDNLMMGQLLQQFSEMQHEPRCGDSNLSDITPFSSRGRASERPPIIPSDGRLGKHIRSTSSHSCAHVEPPDSPGLDSNQAMASRASTEKDAVFLNQGVDEFYEGQAKQNINGHGRKASPHSGISSAQYQQNSKLRQLRTQYLNEVQSSEKVPRQYSKGPGNHHQHLSTPYDMTKTKSTGTSFTQKTQQTSNMTTSQSTKLRSDMARKYMKQKPHINQSTTNRDVSSSAPLFSQDRRALLNQQSQPASPSRLYAKAMQARIPRTHTSNRIS